MKAVIIERHASEYAHNSENHIFKENALINYSVEGLCFKIS